MLQIVSVSVQGRLAHSFRCRSTVLKTWMLPCTGKVAPQSEGEGPLDNIAQTAKLVCIAECVSKALMHTLVAAHVAGTDLQRQNSVPCRVLHVTLHPIKWPTCRHNAHVAYKSSCTRTATFTGHLGVAGCAAPWQRLPELLPDGRFRAVAPLLFTETKP